MRNISLWVGPSICEAIDKGRLRVQVPDGMALTLVGTERVYIGPLDDNNYEAMRGYCARFANQTLIIERV